MSYFFSNIFFCSLLCALCVAKGLFKIKSKITVFNQVIPLNGFTFICLAAFLTKVFCPAIASISEYLPSQQQINLSKVDISNEFANIFEKYNIAKYSISELGQRPCEMENRFTYILVSINRIEETNSNICERYKNLLIRKKNYEKNIQKINKRAKLAQIDLLLEDIPTIDEKKVNLDGPYKRMSLWGNEIDKNIQDTTCDVNCSFNHIDTSSIKIVEEIDSIQKSQNLINKKLTELEHAFDKLEKQQRLKEHQLIAKGY